MSKNGMKTLTVAAAISCALITTAHAAMTISNAKTKNVTCTGGVCTPTGGNANLNTGELQTTLASSDVTVKSSASAPSLGVLDPLTWASTHHLTLDSVQFIHIKAAVVVEGTAGLTLTINDGGTGGDLVFENGGYVNFWDLSSSLVINGQSFTLVKDIKTLASDIAANPSDSYALASNYDASADGTYSNTPITATLSGTFEGLGNQILNFSLGGERRRSTQYAALFDYIAGRVRDITLTNVSITSNSGFGAAALASENAGVLTKVSVTGTISDPNGAAAGLVGINDGTIIGASASVSVSGANGAGGLVEGNNASGTISQSYAGGSVTSTLANNSAGGLAANNFGIITDSRAATSVSGTFAGGLVAFNYQTILRCSATGDVSGSNAGGLVAANYGPVAQSYATGSATGVSAGGLAGSNRGAIKQSYAIGSAEAGTGLHNEAGGLVGWNTRGEISESYSSGAVGSNIPSHGGGDFGGFIGSDRKNRTSNNTDYWDLTTSGIEDLSRGAGHPRNDPGITGLTDAQLKSALPAGFDPNVWGQNASINNGWPYLLANPPPQ